MFTRISHNMLVAIAIGLMLTVIGCSANQSAATTTVFPVGTFKASSGYGDFLLEFKDDGTFTITGNACGCNPSQDVNATPQKSSGTYTVSQNQVIVKGSYCASGDNATGTYTWRFDGTMLTLSSSDDKCNDRWRVLNLAWAKQ